MKEKLSKVLPHASAMERKNKSESLYTRPLQFLRAGQINLEVIGSALGGSAKIQAKLAQL